MVHFRVYTSTDLGIGDRDTLALSAKTLYNKVLCYQSYYNAVKRISSYISLIKKTLKKHANCFPVRYLGKADEEHSTTTPLTRMSPTRKELGKSIQWVPVGAVEVKYGEQT